MQESKYIINNSELMLDWDSELNPNIDISTLTYGSHIKIKWKCHKCGRVWDSKVKNRTAGHGCTCEANAKKEDALRKTLVNKKGSLAELRPDIASQWHPTLNGSLTPNDVTTGSEKKIWWINEDGFSWEAKINTRCRSGKIEKYPAGKVIKGYNDLETTSPELIKEWDFDKNYILPSEVSAGSNKKVWWKCLRVGHSWEASISSRKKRGCPTCNKESSSSFPEQALFFYIRKLFPNAENRYYLETKLEADIFIPDFKIAIEFDGEYYHRSKRKQKIDIRKNKRFEELGINLIRAVGEKANIPDNTKYVVRYASVNRKENLDKCILDVIGIVSKIVGREASIGINVDTSIDEPQILKQYVILEKENSLATKAPELIKQWCVSLNGNLKPEYVPAMSSKRVWWECDKCGHKWIATVSHRYRGTGCPVCTGAIVKAGINDIATTHPYLVCEWSNKNIEKPDTLSAGSNKSIVWKCKDCGFEWKATISNRTRGRGCPQCIGKVVSISNNLRAKYPEIAEEWNYDKNDTLPNEYLPKSEKRVWWKCKSYGHEWEATIGSRTRGNNCPYCGNKIVLSGFNDLETVFPELSRYYDKDKNEIPANRILPGTKDKVWWRCKKGHSWEERISNRLNSKGCPYCTGRRVEQGKNDLKTLYPNLAMEWCEEKNTDISIEEISAGSNRKVWWKCSSCGCTWEAAVWSRTKGRGCPYCAGKKPIPGKTDLTTLNPQLVEEWYYEKNINISPSDVTPGSSKKVWWKCKECGFIWQHDICSRNRGARCPKCVKKKNNRTKEMIDSGIK